MAFQPVLDCAVAQLIGLVNGRDVSFGLNCRFITGNYTQTHIDALAAGVANWAENTVKPLLSTQASYVRVDVRGLESVVDLFATDASGAGAGSTTGVPFPNNVSFVIKHLSGFTGRQARGRTYLWGLSSLAVQTNEDFIDLTYANAWAAAFGALAADITPYGWEHVIIHRYSGGVPVLTPTVYPVTGYNYTDLKLDTRRKRMG